jgi:hypothetical protein
MQACCYDEPEGMFPSGLYTCVEHAPSDQTAWPLIDLFKLKLDGSGEMQRLTYFTDFKGYKANQGVVSDDGKYLSFQIGNSEKQTRKRVSVSVFLLWIWKKLQNT